MNKSAQFLKIDDVVELLHTLNRGIFYVDVTCIDRFDVSAGCADTCTDYHRLCPAIVNPGFINEYKAKLEAGALPNLPRKQIPDFQCTNEEIRIVCPMSCGMCK